MDGSGQEKLMETYKTKRPYADPTAKRRNVHLSEEVWQKLKEIGEGSQSDGIRRLVRQTATTNQ